MKQYLRKQTLGLDEPRVQKYNQHIMDYKPSDFFLGVIDLFAIFLPGLMALFLLKPFVEQLDFLPIEGNERWVTYLIGSYILGHLLFAFGNWFERFGIDKLIGRYPDLHSGAKLFRNAEHFGLPGLNDAHKWSEAQNWAFSFVRLKSPSAMSEIERQAANYKFFRSLIFVFLIAFVVFLYSDRWTTSVLSLGLMSLSFLRYMGLRNVFAERTYEFYILLKENTQEEKEKKNQLPKEREKGNE